MKKFLMLIFLSSYVLGNQFEILSPAEINKAVEPICLDYKSRIEIAAIHKLQNYGLTQEGLDRYYSEFIEPFRLLVQDEIGNGGDNGNADQAYKHYRAIIEKCNRLKMSNEELGESCSVAVITTAKNMLKKIKPETTAVKISELAKTFSQLTHKQAIVSYLMENPSGVFDLHTQYSKLRNFVSDSRDMGINGAFRRAELELEKLSFLSGSRLLDKEHNFTKEEYEIMADFLSTNTIGIFTRALVGRVYGLRSEYLQPRRFYIAMKMNKERRKFDEVAHSVNYRVANDGETLVLTLDESLTLEYDLINERFVSARVEISDMGGTITSSFDVTLKEGQLLTNDFLHPRSAINYENGLCSDLFKVHGESIEAVDQFKISDYNGTSDSLINTTFESSVNKSLIK